MKVYDLYGFASIDLDAARRTIESALDITLVGRDSTYHGGDYFRFQGEGEERLLLKSNVDSFDDEPAETDYPDQPFLLYVDGSDRCDEIRSKLLGLEGVAFLRRRELDDVVRPT